MSTEANKANARRFYEEVWNQAKVDVVDESNAPNFTDRTPAPGIPPTSEGLKQLITMYRTAFPDVHFTVEDVIADGDSVVVRWTAQGTHQHELMGLPPTNQRVTVTGIDLYRIANGRTVEHWGNWDQLGLLQQLGAIPTPGQPTG